MSQRLASPLLERARAAIAEQRMLLPNERVLLAVSGGADSVALLAALSELAAELQVSIVAAHLNHGLRGAESLRDECCAAEVARRLGVSCRVGRIELSPHLANLEERAREARYAFLEDVAGQFGCAKIATGHTRDDQAETVLMRLVRGAGLDGMGGIRAMRDGRIIRPLLSCSRAEVVAFLQENDLPWCEDSSNSDRRFLRNRIRHEVLPMLESCNPGIRDSLASVASIAAAEAKHLDDGLAPLLADALAPDGALALAVVFAVAPALRGRLIRLWLRQVRGDLRRLSAAHFESILRMTTSPRPNVQAQLPGGEVVVREYERLRFIDEPAAAGFVAQELAVDTPIALPNGWQLHALIGDAEQGRVRDPSLLHFVGDADRLPAPLILRAARAGDRIQPLGMHGHKKLQDIFVDRKVPRRIRHTTPVLEAAGEILWVPGMVRSNKALVSDETSRTLCIVAAQAGIAGA